MRKQKIAIVGAGLAGIYAAYRLHKAEIDFDLFEARVIPLNPVRRASVASKEKVTRHKGETSRGGQWRK